MQPEPVYASILRLEARLEPELAGWTGQRAASPAWLADAASWADAVWVAALAEGPAPLSPAERDDGLALARRPVFIVGAHRSGTTLVRDLLDDHPALVVLPAEGGFLTGFARRLERVPAAERAGCMAREWLRRTVNPINQPPFWLLGRSAPDASPYVDFARRILAWWSIVHDALDGTAPAPLVAVALAWAGTRLGPRPAGVRPLAGLHAWVEKTPTQERFLPRLRAAFPMARLIHVVRDPHDTFASRKAIEARAGLPFRTARALREIARSYAVALRNTRASDDAYFLLRCEDLLHDPDRLTRDLAAFLDIEWQPSLLRPSVAGLPARPNSAFQPASPDGDGDSGRLQTTTALRRAETLSPRERAHIDARLAAAAGRLGYDIPVPPLWRRAVAALRSQLP